MIKTKQRPIHLDLRRIRMPINAITSIGHRISGVLIFLLMPAGIFLLDLSLMSPEGFATVAAVFDSFLGKAILLLLMWAFVHHLLAGLRCISIDVDCGVEKPFFLKTARIVLLAAFPVALLLWTAL
ncbi:succinate dehydrogenase, cytochrome b556 subunit [Pseudomonadota bacterium]